LEKKTRELESCYVQCLEIVKKYELRSVAFCCISTGIYGYPKKPAAKVALSSVREWIDKNGLESIDRIIFCMFLDEEEQIYSKLMNKYFL